ncbi:hypothetical protein OHR68_20215 [Spirillospora sp. NBC_00431]
MKRLSYYPSEPGPFTIVMPNRDLPAKGWNSRMGPGWSWMAVSGPFSGDRGPSAKYRFGVFEEENQARADLQQLLDEGNHVQDGGKAASVLRGAGSGELILVANTNWAFGLYRVEDGEHCAGAGCSFYDGWIVGLENDPQRARHINSEAGYGRPMVFTASG